MIASMTVIFQPSSNIAFPLLNNFLWDLESLLEFNPICSFNMVKWTDLRIWFLIYKWIWWCIFFWKYFETMKVVHRSYFPGNRTKTQKGHILKVRPVGGVRAGLSGWYPLFCLAKGSFSCSILKRASQSLWALEFVFYQGWLSLSVNSPWPC